MNFLSQAIFYFINSLIDFLAGERMATEGCASRQELFETASLCTGDIIWLREKKGDSFIIPECWKERYTGLELINGIHLEETSATSLSLSSHSSSPHHIVLIKPPFSSCSFFASSREWAS